MYWCNKHSQQLLHRRCACLMQKADVESVPSPQLKDLSGHCIHVTQALRCMRTFNGPQVRESVKLQGLDNINCMCMAKRPLLTWITACLCRKKNIQKIIDMCSNALLALASSTRLAKDVNATRELLHMSRDLWDMCNKSLVAWASS